MGLLDDIREDIKDLTSDVDSGGVEMTLTAPNAETATINGYHSKHNLGVDPDSGKQINTKNAHISFSESVLLAANSNYPLRNLKGDVYLKKHKVSAKDSTGLVCNYVINEWFPDETVGLIVCILGDFE